MDSFGQFFANYGEYHHNKVNMFIHIVCIPLIVFTLLGLLTPIRGIVPFIGIDGLLGFGVSYLYIKTEPLCGGLTSFWIWFEIVVVRNLTAIAEQEKWLSTLYFYFTAIHIVSWGAQFVGHGMFERRKPALMDNLLLILNAPFFVTAELLKMFGWKKEQFELIDKEIKDRVLKFHGSHKTGIH